jgi:hypothetical protein
LNKVAGQGSWNWTAGIGQPVQDRQEGTARAEQQVQENRGRTALAGLTGQDRRDRASGTRHLRQDIGDKDSSGQDSRDRPDWINRSDRSPWTGKRGHKLFGKRIHIFEKKIQIFTKMFTETDTFGENFLDKIFENQYFQENKNFRRISLNFRFSRNQISHFLFDSTSSAIE